ncbi:CsbD family protein [Paraburkholderia acidisoli]|uniref:CsbD family protein n=1 Tax=Paraburkholderia acidisoli TaxID=2571748 RepID=A0A7Z2GKJ4_9BURK|nr:CsbD family protein [Paraburkholderia acidisoli]QGZ63209.1 CsbD family protein [Paraburkholderia acidisoli]
MNKDQVKGTAEKMKGKVNEAVGRATDNPARELKGDLQQEAGQARKNVGDMKEAAKDSIKRHH